MNHTLSLSSSAPLSTAQPRLQPLGGLTSLLYFGIPAALTFASFHAWQPWLERQGYSELVSYLAAMIVPLALLFSGALIVYNRCEKRPLTWAAFAERMRLRRLTGRDLLLSLLILAVGTLGYGLFSAASMVLIRAGLLTIPADAPALTNPLIALTRESLAQSAGGHIQGLWAAALLALIMFFFNIVGEELWWRGIILPRQELALGRFAWLYHGVLWALFHIFKWWDVLPLLPVCLILPYISQRTRSNWPALIGHALMNVGGPLVIILAVMGIQF
jgi:membrane protease YdiL (CAAX protease family)